MNVIGYHVTIDGYYSPNSPIATVAGGSAFLKAFTAAIGMTLAREPEVFPFPMLPKEYSKLVTTNPVLKDNNCSIVGISGTAILKESHIAYHTFPEIMLDNNFFVSLDIYSCRAYDINVVKSFLKTSGVVSGTGLLLNRQFGLQTPQILPFVLS